MLNNIKFADKVLYVLIATFVMVFVWSSISPYDRGDWILENILVVGIVAIFIGTYKLFRFSTASYIAIVLFLILHEFGAHYTYSLVPYDDWFSAYFGLSLNEFMGWERNHFDRLVHFLFGVLWVYPAKEFYAKKLLLTNYWSWFFAVQSVAAFSLLYELIEWGVAIIFGGELGMHYLGTQGDIWDAHKDMLLAILGALMVWMIVGLSGEKHEK